MIFLLLSLCSHNYLIQDKDIHILFMIYYVYKYII